MKTKTLMISLTLVLIQLLNASQAKAQAPSSSKIYMPLDIKRAYKNGTRSFDGLPGKNFWQNTCNYKIQASINLTNRELTGREYIDYINNSPDTLKKMVFHTYQDAFRKGSLRSYDIREETEGLILGLLIINGDTISNKNYKQSYTLLDISLKKPILPRSISKIDITWKIQIKGKPEFREGFIDSTSAFIGLWYPKICVYDDLFNWNEDIYNLKDEFNSPLSTYDVSVSLPKGFLVWATGTLVNQENYPLLIRDRLRNCYSSGQIETIIDSTTILDQGEAGKEPWKFHADSVPDFAFAFAKNFAWDAGVFSIANKKVLISSVYPVKLSSHPNQITKVVKNAMEIYSLKDPGVEYPYPYFTSFCGGGSGGMEYPMMSFDEPVINAVYSPYLFIHEFLHSYQPFYLRTNETKFAWMDEGITDFYAFKICKNFNYDLTAINLSYEKYDEPGLKGIGNMPLLVTSSNYAIENYTGMCYCKPPQMLTSLEDLIGPELWKNCFAAFTNTWKYKSPMPFDFMFFIESYTKKDLFWFWDAWFMHFGMPDLSVQRVANNRITLENKGGLPIPFTLEITDNNGKKEQIQYHADCWSKGRLFEIKHPTDKLSKVEVKCDLVKDYNLADNIWNK
jgi:hypothetical protein